MKCCKKLELASKSGSGASKVPTCQHYEQLLFLKDYVSNRVTTSNVVLSSNGEDSEQLDDCDIQENSAESSETVIPTLKRPLPKQQHESVPKRRKEIETRKAAERRDSIDLLLAKSLAKCDEQENTCEKPSSSAENDSDLLYLRSLLPILKKLAPRKNRLARMSRCVTRIA